MAIVNSQGEEKGYYFSSRMNNRYFRWLRLISVEPTMWLFMMAYMITSVVELAFFMHKACRIDHGFSEEVCSDLEHNKTAKEIVQVTMSNFQQWNNIASHVVPAILAMFMGNWSDRRGRKFPLLIGLVGKLVYSSMIVVNSLMSSWNLNMVIYTASLPMALLGGDVAIFGACFAYVSDITTVRDRTMRVMILDVVYLSTMPIGVAIGSYIFKRVVHSSYTIMFTINSILLVCSILYTLCRLQWQSTNRQESLRGVNVFKDFFDKGHVIATMKTLTKPRAGFRRLHMWILLIAMMLYTFQRDEKPMSYLYTQLIFKWDVVKFSTFRTFQSAFFVVAMLVGVPVLSKLLKIQDTTIVAIGALSHACGRIIFATANIPELFYVGAAVAGLGPIVAPVVRSMASKVVPIEERGKIFSMLSVCDNAVPLLSSPLYTQIYNATLTTIPSTIYWLTFGTQIAVMMLILVIKIARNSDDHEDSALESETDSTPPPPISQYEDDNKTSDGIFTAPESTQFNKITNK